MEGWKTKNSELYSTLLLAHTHCKNILPKFILGLGLGFIYAEKTTYLLNYMKVLKFSYYAVLV